MGKVPFGTVNFTEYKNILTTFSLERICHMKLDFGKLVCSLLTFAYTMWEKNYPPIDLKINTPSIFESQQ